MFTDILYTLALLFALGIAIASLGLLIVGWARLSGFSAAPRYSRRLAGFIRRLFGRRGYTGVRLFSYTPQWPGCGAEREMKLLIKFSRSGANRDTGQVPDGARHARRCVAASQARGSYHSRLLQHESGVRKADGMRGAFICVWLIDFAKPGNFRVTQVTGGEASYNDFDRWATIGDQHYEWISFQMTGKPQPPGLLRRNNQFLTIDKWLLPLVKGQLVGANIYRAYGRRYVLLEYQASKPSGVLVEQLTPEVSAYRETVHLWIDEESGLLVKGVLEATAQLRTGEELPPTQLQQVFGGYDHDLRFDPRVPFPELTGRG